MKKSFAFIVTAGVLFFALISCSNSSGGGGENIPRAIWARGAAATVGHSRFFGVTTDPSSCVYAAGSMSGNEIFTFGNSVTAQATDVADLQPNALLVKYNSAGNPQWAKTVAIGSDESRFMAVASDSSSNVYAAGYITGTDFFDFGNGQTVAAGSGQENCVLVKYNSAGETLWAVSVTGDNRSSYFTAVATDSSGNIYAAGGIGNGTFDFGNGVTATITGTADENALLVKYNPAGLALWAKIISGSSAYYSVATDSGSNVYAAGYIGSFFYDFGNSVTVTGTQDQNALAVKYAPDGTALQSYVPASADGDSLFAAIALDSGANVYMAGQVAGGNYGFGNSVSVSGTQEQNALLVKYNASAAAQWAQTPSGTNISLFTALFADSIGNLYATAQLDGINTFTFAGTFVIAGTTAENGALIKFNTAGAPQWAFIAAGTDSYYYNSVVEDQYGQVYVAGILRTGLFSFGNGVAFSGTDMRNCVLIKYRQ